MKSKIKFTMNFITLFTIFMVVVETFVPVGDYMNENFGLFSSIVANILLAVSFINIVRILKENSDLIKDDSDELK